MELSAFLDRQGGRPITFLCVPPGDGYRSALDRDLDGVLDGDEATAVQKTVTTGPKAEASSNNR